MNLDIEIGKLAEYIEEFNKVTLLDNREIRIDDLNIQVTTPTGVANIDWFIKKMNLPMVRITFKDGHVLECASRHILQTNGKDIEAGKLKPMNFIESTSEKQVYSVENLKNADCFDISIPNPHLYYDKAGILHHNTLITAALSHLCEEHGRTVVIVPNKGLVSQTEADYKNIGLDVGVYYGDRKEPGHQHTICTWQSLSILDKNSKKPKAEVTQLDIDTFTKDVIAVIVDEAHQSKAEVLKSLLAGPLAHVPIRWGLTGTIPQEEHDAMSLYACIGPVVHNLAASTLMDMGVLAQCNVEILQLMDTVEYQSFHEEYEFLVTDSTRLDWMSEFIQNKATLGNTLVLVNRIETGTQLAARLPAASFVYGNIKNEARNVVYDEIADQDNKIILASYGVAAVGINLPRIFNLILVEPGKSHIRVIQSIGRGVRKAKDKDSVDIFDLGSTCKFSSKHITSRKRIYKAASYPFKVLKIDYLKELREGKVHGTKMIQ